MIVTVPASEPMDPEQKPQGKHNGPETTRFRNGCDGSDIISRECIFKLQERSPLERVAGPPFTVQAERAGVL
jgi:hypothetical protein